MSLVCRAGTVSTLLVLSFVGSTVISGQAAPVGSPAAVADSFLTAIAAEHWSAAAGYLELQAFEVIRQQSMESTRWQRSFPPPAAEELMARDSTMPRAVAEYEVQRLKRSREQQPSFLSLQFAGVANADSLAAMSTIDAAARWLQARDPRWRMRESAIRNGCSAQVADYVLRRSPDLLLGTVFRDTLAYVLFEPGALGKALDRKRGSREPPVAEPSVLVLRRSADRWRIVPREELLVRNGTAFFVGCEVTKHPPR